MVYVDLKDELSGNLLHIFVADYATRHDYKSLLTMPGEYDEFVAATGVKLKFGKLECKVGSYCSKMYAFYIEGTVEMPEDSTSLTKEVENLLPMPPTVLQTVSTMYADKWEDIQLSLSAIHYYEQITKESVLSLPATIEGLSEEEKASMLSRQVDYILKPIDNQSVFQKTSDSNFNIKLPSIDEVHRVPDCISALDMLRVVAPYRKSVGNLFSYSSIYHTPYWRIDPRTRGQAPSYLNWLSGLASNDTLDIQPNEKQLYDNLHTLVYADLSRYASAIATGILLSTKQGMLVSKLCTMQGDALFELHKDITAITDGFSVELTFSDIEEFVSHSDSEYLGTRTAKIRDSIKVTDDYIKSLIRNPSLNRIVDVDNLPFVLSFTDSQIADFIQMFISMGYITSAMNRFLDLFCKCAYEVSWGHTGATMAIPGFIAKSSLLDIDKELEEYIGETLNNQLVDPNKYQYIFLRSPQSDDGDDNFGTESEDEIFTRLNYYIADETMKRLVEDTLESDYFATYRGNTSIVQSKEASIIEYWRVNNGEMNLEEYLSRVYASRHKISDLIAIGIKLLRWGERRPKTIVVDDFAVAFDLNSGRIVNNTAVVDESKLVKVNGCDYTLAGFLTTESNPGIDPKHIIGFILQKDYGDVVKVHLASWMDMAGLIAPTAINVANFKTMESLSGFKSYKIEDIAKLDYNIFLSDQNIKEGLELRVPPRDLNPMSLLVIPGVTNTASFLRAIKDDVVVTARDRAYDITNRYVKTIAKFYATKAEELASLSTTLDFAQLIFEFNELQSKSGKKEDINSVTSAGAMKKLNLDMGSESKITWDESDLSSSKFFVISDMEMVSGLPPLEFTDQKMQSISKSVRNRVVMLLANTGSSFVFCREDIKPAQLAYTSAPGPNGMTYKVGHKKYSVFDATIKKLSSGGSATINGIPATLHISLKDYITTR